MTSEIAFPNFSCLCGMALFPVFQAGTAWGSLFKLPGCCNSMHRAQDALPKSGLLEVDCSSAFCYPPGLKTVAEDELTKSK